jgi:hypothetical protein
VFFFEQMSIAIAKASQGVSQILPVACTQLRIDQCQGLAIISIISLFSGGIAT